MLVIKSTDQKISIKFHNSLPSAILIIGFIKIAEEVHTTAKVICSL